MPTGFELCEKERIVYSRAWGDVTEAELTQHMESVGKFLSEGTIDATWAQVFDFTEADSADSLASTGVQSLAKKNPWPKESIRALVVRSQWVHGLCRMFLILADLEDTGAVKLTKTVAEAKAFIQAKRANKANRMQTDAAVPRC